MEYWCYALVNPRLDEIYFDIFLTYYRKKYREK